MNTKRIINELRKLPVSAKSKVDFGSEYWVTVEEKLSQMPLRERVNAFHAVRFVHYEQFISDLGYLPTEFILEALSHCASALCNVKQLRDDEVHNRYALLYKIRTIGEGVAKAADLDQIKHRPLDITAFSTHQILTELSPEATAGDCFLFNAMIFASDAPQHNGISIPPVVEKYYKRFCSLNEPSDENLSLISISLDIAVDDVFGAGGFIGYRPVGVVPEQTSSNNIWTKIIFSAGLVAFFVWVFI